MSRHGFEPFCRHVLAAIIPLAAAILIAAAPLSGSPRPAQTAAAGFEKARIIILANPTKFSNLQ